MIKYIFNTIINHQNDEKMTLRYFNDISRYEQALTSAIAAAQTSDPVVQYNVFKRIVTQFQS